MRNQERARRTASPGRASNPLSRRALRSALPTCLPLGSRGESPGWSRTVLGGPDKGKLCTSNILAIVGGPQWIGDEL